MKILLHHLSSLILLLSAVATSMAHAAEDSDPAAFFESSTIEDKTAYLSWLNESSSKYDTSIFIESSAANGEGVGVFWSINQDEQTIDLAVAAQATGWAAFGIGEAGGMRGADMVVFETATNDIYDGHVLDDINAGPIKDVCQNWELTNQIVDGGFIIFEVRRLLDTGDTFDRAIIDDSDLALVPPSRVIAAWGDSDTATYHGNNRARSSVRFFRTTGDDEAAFRQAMAVEAEDSFELRAVDYPIKQVDTEYAHFCFTNKDLIAKGMPADTPLHMIGVEPLVDMDAKAHVHHFVLLASTEKYDDANFTTQEQCDEGLQAFEMAYVWAPGEGSLVLPSNVGGPIGLDGFQSFKLQIHYDNPSKVAGVLDSSGIRMYFTSKKREHDLGILQIGDPFIGLFNQTVGPGLVSHTFDCPGECSALLLSNKLTVIREYVHMHASGKRMYNEQIRDGQVIRTATFDFWDFDQQGDPPVQQGSFEILPGDAFRTRCYFDSNDGEVWGLASQDEMCISFLFYYPRYEGEGAYICGVGIGETFGLDECEVGYERNTLENVDELDRGFGSGSGECKALAANASSAAFAKTALAFGMVVVGTLVGVV